LWRDSLVLAIYPDRIAWLRTAGMRQARITAKDVVSFFVDQQAPWRNALSALPEILNAAKAGGLRVTVLLSNRLFRYAIVSNPDSARTPDELDLLAQHAFERAHGDAVSGWDIRLSDSAPGQAALASALDREFVSALKDTVAVSGTRLISIQPYLMAAFNRHQRTLAPRHGVFILVEPERLTLLAWQNAGWHGVLQMHAMSDWRGDVGRALDRLAVTLELDEGYPLYLFAPELAEAGSATEIAEIGKTADTSLEKSNRSIEMLMPAWPPELAIGQDRVFAGAMLALP
jgi:hypothetical protein